ncbi:MAG: ABC transporter ATP-binding protein [Clostridiales bacterium]|nr:ABC transporter ATP-binding protein [Clostridiales bacterium]
MNMIEAKKICKKFTEREVLSGIDLDIRPGMIFGLLGPSGAGKTTLIKIITGQLVFESGEVKVFGKNVADLTGEDKRQIGIMMDDHGVYERMSCAENLKIFADIYGVPYSNIAKTLKEVGLEDAAKKPAMKLSKGMRARLRLARVLMVSPKLLFLDEPTSGLDPMTMRYIHKLIMEQKEKGCTVFLTTHNMEEASVLCDEVALLNEGKIIERGAPEDVCRRYNHQRKILIHLTTGEDIELAHDTDSAGKISSLIEQGTVETIHSSEPSLETVFIELTGRRLESEEEVKYA